MARESQLDTVHVGTSGWTYDDWAGAFYPPGVKGSDRLGYYAQQFDTVEVNATFYRLPSAAMVAAWNRRLPGDFHLVLKGPRLVTHRKHLEDCAEPLAAFLRAAAPLERLRVILWQFPPTLTCDLPRLEAFLALLPPTVRHAVEFRHESWWDDAVMQTLARYGAAFVAVSHPRLPPVVLPGADFLYVRFHGLGSRLYDYDYSEGELREWSQRLEPHRCGRELYAFFNNDYRAQAIGNALAFRALLSSG